MPKKNVEELKLVKKDWSRSPTLETIKRVEDFISKNSKKMNRRELWKALPKKIMWQTYLVILEYLINLEKVDIDTSGKLISKKIVCEEKPITESLKNSLSLQQTPLQQKKKLVPSYIG